MGGQSFQLSIPDSSARDSTGLPSKSSRWRWSAIVSSPDALDVRGVLGSLEADVASLASLVGRGLMSARAAEASLLEVRRRIAGIEAKRTDAGKVDVLGPLATSEDTRAIWQGHDGDRRRAVVRALMDIELRSRGNGSRAPRDGTGRIAHTAARVALTWH